MDIIEELRLPDNLDRIFILKMRNIAYLSCCNFDMSHIYSFIVSGESPSTVLFSFFIAIPLKLLQLRLETVIF